MRIRTKGGKVNTQLCAGGFLMAVLSLLTGAGCGYKFLGAAEGLPKDIRTVYVEPFVNRSMEVGIEAELASAVKSDFHRRGEIRVVDRLEQADAIVTGVVRSFDNAVVAVNSKDEILQFQAVLIVDVTLRRRTPDEILWRSQNTRLSALHSGSRGAVVTTSSDFKRGTLNPNDIRQFTDVQLTEALDYDTKERLIQEFARELHQRLIERF